MPSTSLLAVQIGNTRVQLGLFVDEKLDIASIVAEAVRLWDEIKDDPQAAVMLASVNEKAAKSIQSALEDQLSVDIYRIGDDVPIPIGESLDPETLVGADRLLNAAAAWDRLKQACVIIDAGTAVTVDFVDGEGTFHGGAIAPGLALQLKSLHEHTDALPTVEFRKPSGEAWGRNTVEAMLRGVYEGVRGLAWRLVERYAEQYGAFPLVIATGGDAEVLFREDELVNRIVPELTLQGMAVAARHALTTDDTDGTEGGSTGEDA
jgi:type III pantothenate kinase